VTNRYIEYLDYRCILIRKGEVILMNTFRLLGLSTLAALLLLAFPISAQTVTGVELNNSSSPPAWNSWNSIYGSSLYTGSTTFVFFDFTCTNGTSTQSCFAQISSSSPDQTYWYDSSTQVNYYAIAYPLQPGYTAESGCYTNNGLTLCNDTGVCTPFGSGFVCSNLYHVTYTGTP
jgi:hypothetical protein